MNDAGLDIGELSKRVEDLTTTAATSQWWYNFFVGLAAIAAAIAFILQLIHDNHEDRLKSSYEQLVAAKDDQRQRDIAKVEGDAKTEAARIAGEAKKDVAAARDESEKSIAAARNEAGVKIASLESEAANAKLEVEKLRERNNDMEIALRPRRLWFSHPDENKRYANLMPLYPFAGITVHIWYLPEEEPHRAAAAIATMLNEVGWNVVEVSRSDEMYLSPRDGVQITPHWPKFDDESPDRNRARDAARALEGVLLDHDWEASQMPPRQDMAPNTIFIIVGLKPMDAFLPESLRTKKDLRELREYQKAIDKALKDGSPFPSLPRLPRSPDEKK